MGIYYRKGLLCCVYFEHSFDGNDFSNLWVFYKFFLSYIKLSQRAHLTDYQRNRDVILNIAKDYCENDEERLRSQARDNIETYLKKKKIKRENTKKNRYCNEEKKQRLK